MISLFQMLKSIVARLEKTKRDFIWVGGSLQNKPQLISWKICCRKKRDVGLRIESLSTLHQAWLAKWN